MKGESKYDAPLKVLPPKDTTKSNFILITKVLNKNMKITTHHGLSWRWSSELNQCVRPK